MSLSIFEVSVPADETCLLSEEELRQTAGVGNSVASDDLLISLGRNASAAIARSCCIREDGVNPPTLLEEICNDTFRWSDCGPIRLSRRPVTSILSVTVDGNMFTADTYEIANRDLYFLSGNDRADWAAGRIVVSYVAGYSTAPGDIKLAASKMVAALFIESGRDPNLRSEDIPGVVSRQWWVEPASNPLLSRQVMDLLSPYVERFI